MKIDGIQNPLEIFNDLPVSRERKITHPDQGFGQLLKKSIDDINSLQKEANQAIENISTGKEEDVHTAMIAMEKASVSFQLMMQVRNKIINAYETIMRMPV